MIEIIIMAVSGFLFYMSCHCAAEQKLGKKILLPWEKKNETK